MSRDLLAMISVAIYNVRGIVQIDDGSSWFVCIRFTASLGVPVMGVSAVNGPITMFSSLREPRVYDTRGGK